MLIGNLLRAHADLCRLYVSPQRAYAVGGFATNPYVIAQLKKRLADNGVSLHCPDDQA